LPDPKQDPDQDSEPKLPEKSDPESDPKQILLDPQFCPDPHANPQCEPMWSRNTDIKPIYVVGKDWFNMAALELTEERKNDLELLQMRGALDPKR
jgi:hypothetical protein